MITWTAVGVFVVIGGGLLAMIRRGFELKQNLHEQRKSERAATKAAIESHFLVPRLAELVVQITTAIAPYDPGNEDQDEYQYRVLLQLEKATQISDIDEVTQLHSDYADISELEKSMGRWGKREAWAALFALPGVAYWAFVLSWSDMPESETLQFMAGILALTALITFGFCRLQERRVGDLLVDLYQNYEITTNDD